MHELHSSRPQPTRKKLRTSRALDGWSIQATSMIYGYGSKLDTPEMERLTQQNAKIWAHIWVAIPVVNQYAGSARLKCTCTSFSMWRSGVFFQLPWSISGDSSKRALSVSLSLLFSFCYITFTQNQHLTCKNVDWTVPGYWNSTKQPRRIGVLRNMKWGFHQDISCHWPLPYPGQIWKLGMLSCATHRFSCTIGSHQNVRRLFSSCLPCVFSWIRYCISYFMCSFITHKYMPLPHKGRPIIPIELLVSFSNFPMVQWVYSHAVSTEFRDFWIIFDEINRPPN
jgi:hypothetical protein